MPNDFSNVVRLFLGFSSAVSFFLGKGGDTDFGANCFTEKTKTPRVVSFFLERGQDTLFGVIRQIGVRKTPPAKQGNKRE